MNETFLIHIEIAGRRYPITIQRDKEESMRAAAKQINQKVLQYQSKYGTQLDTQDMLAMIALQLSVENLAWEMISLVLEGEPVSVRFNDRSTFRRFEKNFDGYMQSYADHFERDVNLSRMPDPVQLACTLLP